jgi:hypothetical protein
MGAIALALLGTEMPGLLKYPIVAIATWVSSNLIAWGYRRAVLRVGRRT